MPVLGRTLPRIWTPPRVEGPPGPCGCGCALTAATSLGFAFEEFARDLVGRPLDPWQRWVAIHALELMPNGWVRFRQVLVLVARQNGKALDVETPMLTTQGWKTMGTLVPGDEVFHPGGHAIRVTGAFDEMHDRQCFRVTTSDGRSVVADAEHLWTVTDKRRSRSIGPRGSAVRSFETVTMTTAQLVEAGLGRAATGARARNEFRFSLPVQEPVKSCDVDLPIDPYLLGAWLGDGTSRSAALTVGQVDLEHMVAAVERVGTVVSRTLDPRPNGAWRLGFRLEARKHDGFQSRAMRLGLWGNKHIPDSYLTAGTSQREALLQGLMDTDGSISAAGQAEFCSMSRPLADGVLYLARSLGWRATLRTARATIAGRDCGEKYRVCFTPVRTDPFTPFRLSRKAARIRAVDGGKGRTTVSIASVEPVESRPVRCIKVDSPDGLFLAGRDLVATHNTELCVLLTLFWLFVLQVPMVLGTSTKLDYAKESWSKAYKLARATKDLVDEIGGKRSTNGEQEWWLVDPDDPEEQGPRYKIGASNEEGGRSLTVHRLIEDELRQHHTWEAHEAAENAMNAVADGQAWAISNAGDRRSVVLNSLRKSAMEFIDTGEGDGRLFLAEYSAPLGASVTDVDALAQANPNLGRRIEVAALLGKAVRAAAAGGEQEAKFRTEVMCQSVPSTKPKPITAEVWAATERDLILTGPPAFFVTVESGARSGSIAVAADAEWPHLVDGQDHDRGQCPIEEWRDAGPADEPCVIRGPHVELADHRPGTNWMAARIIELHQRFPDAPIAAMAKGPVAEMAPELTRLGLDIELLLSTAMIRACGYLEKLGTGFSHSPEPLVDAALQGAEVRYLDQATWAWDWKTSKGNLAPLVAETLVLWLLEKHREDDYDLLDSFG